MKKSQDEIQPETRLEKLRKGFSLMSLGTKSQLGDKLVSRKTGKLVDCPPNLVGIPVVKRGPVWYRPQKSRNSSKPS